MRLGCVLLAAGSGARFGGDKLLHAIDGVSLIARACRLHAADLYCARILVARPLDTGVARVAEAHGFTVVFNERAAQGIGTSASEGAAALLRLSEPVDGALFAVCDQPYLTLQTVAALISRFASAPDAIVAPAYNGRRGNPVIFPGELLGEIVSLDADIGGSAIIGAHRDRLIAVAIDDPAELIDIDYKADESRSHLC